MTLVKNNLDAGQGRQHSTLVQARVIGTASLGTGSLVPRPHAEVGSGNETTYKGASFISWITVF